MRTVPAVWASTALMTFALNFDASAGRCEAAEPARRPTAEPAAGIPAPRFEATGLSLVRPYVRGKIPVVLIHGLGFSPRSWARMIEGLEADPILRANYQFWTFSYPTGEPILYSASVLRRALLQARAQYDPDGSDPAFDRMVLIGHSLGGLLAKLMVQDSRSRLWETISAQPAERLDGPAEARELLRQAFLFKPLPGVRRIIFIATPHRGSRLDRGAHPRARLATHPAWGPLAAGLCDPPGEQPPRFLPQHLPGGTSHQRRPTDVGPSPAPGPSRRGDRSGGEVSLDHRRPP